MSRCSMCTVKCFLSASSDPEKTASSTLVCGRRWGQKGRVGPELWRLVGEAGGREEGQEVALLWGLGRRVMQIFVGGFPWVWGRGGPTTCHPSGVPHRSSLGGRNGF